MINVAIVTCVYKRQFIFELFLLNLIELTKQLKDDYKFTLYIGGSKDDDVTTYCMYALYNALYKYEINIHWIEHPNKPLGNKWNKVLQSIDKDFDYIFITGSDDIFNRRLFDKYKQLIDEGHDYIGLLDTFFLDIFTLRLGQWEGYQDERKGETDGGGRMIAKHIIEANNYKLWEDSLNSSLDGNMTTRISVAKKPIAIEGWKNGIYLIDIKSDVNICMFDMRELRPFDLTMFQDDIYVYNEIYKLSQWYQFQIDIGKIKIEDTVKTGEEYPFS